MKTITFKVDQEKLAALLKSYPHVAAPVAMRLLSALLDSKSGGIDDYHAYLGVYGIDVVPQSTIAKPLT